MNASKLIDKRIKELDDWRGPLLARLRTLILSAAPNLVEEWKWDTPVWSSNGNVVAAGAFKDHIKLNFFRGALLTDSQHLFNAGLNAKATRAIDFFENDKIDEARLKELIRAAADLNNAKSKPAKPASPQKQTKTSKAESDLPKLAAPAVRALAGAGISNLKQVSKYTEEQVKELHGMGPNALGVLRQALAEKGLSFKVGGKR